MVFNLMANCFSNLKRRRAIKKYAKKLGPTLKKKYGRSNYYSPGQIKTAASNANLSISHICVGYAMYMEKDAFDKLHQEMGEQCSYEGIRTEIGNLCFSGDNSFTTSDTMTYGVDSSDFTDGVGFTGDGGD